MKRSRRLEMAIVINRKSSILFIRFVLEHPSALVSRRCCIKS